MRLPFLHFESGLELIVQRFHAAYDRRRDAGELLAEAPLEFGRRLVQQVGRDDPALLFIVGCQAFYEWRQHVHAVRVERRAAVDG